MKKITVNELKKVLKQTLAEEKAVDLLREEVVQNMGPIVITDVKLERLAENINDRIDVLERTGRIGSLNFKPAVLLRFAEHKNPEVRRFVARLLPERLSERFIFDGDHSVRYAAARKASARVLKEMLNTTPSDDELNVIYRNRVLREAKEKQERSIGERLKGVVKQSAAPGLIDYAYEQLASEAIKLYNKNIEGMWDEPFAARYCASINASLNTKYDPAKLWKEIQRQLNDKDDRTLERFSLKEAAREILESVDDDDIVIYEEKDELAGLLDTSLSAYEHVNRVNRAFNIRESIMPAGLRKFRFSEGRASELVIPCTGRFPAGVHLCERVERILDMYVNNWNDLQSRRGEPIKIGWTPNTMSAGSFSFNVELK